MAKKLFLVDIDLNRNQLSNAVLMNVGTAPTPANGLMYFNSTPGVMTPYIHNGTKWLPMVNLDHTGDITSDGATAAFRSFAANSILANATGSAAVPSDLVATDNSVLRRIGTGALAFGLLENANIAANAAIAFSKLAALPSTNILVGNASNVPTAVAMSGHATLSNAGVLSISSGVIVNSHINTSAGINFSKLENGLALSVLGVAGNAAGAVASIAAGTDGYVLRRAGTTLGFGTVATAGIADNAVTLAKIQDIATSTLIGRTTAGTGNPEVLTVISDLASASSTNFATAQAVKSYVDGLLSANDAMVFKGTIGTGGTVTALPTTGYASGWTYRVITAGTYAGKVCEVGDLIVAVTTYTTATSNDHWTVVQTNIDGAVTGPASSVDNRVALFSGTSGKIIKDSGILISALAPLASPTFTGTPIAPTPATADDSTKIATTAFVKAQGYQLAANSLGKYTALIGNGTNTSISVTHSLGNDNVVAQVQEAASGEIVECEMVIGTGTVTFNFNVAPAANAYRVTIIG